MAKVFAPFKIKGSTGDTTFCETEFGQIMKLKSGPSAWQVNNLDSMANTRHNAAEWKRATAAAQLMRHALGSLLASVRLPRLSGRMNGPILAAIKADPIHDRGERVITAGDLSVLAGFEFNRKLSLNDALPLNVENCYSLEAGKVTVDIPAFRLRRKKGIPAEATHYRLVSCVLTIDFAKRTYHQEKRVGNLQAMGHKAGEAFNLSQVVQPVNEQGCFWLMGIEFYKLVNDMPKLVRGGALRVMQWVGKAQSGEVARPKVEDVEKDVCVAGLKCEVSAESIMLKAPVPAEPMVELVDAAETVVPAELIPEEIDTALDNTDEEFEKSLDVSLPVGMLSEIPQAYRGHDLAEVSVEDIFVYLTKQYTGQEILTNSKNCCNNVSLRLSTPF